VVLCPNPSTPYFGPWFVFFKSTKIDYSIVVTNPLILGFVFFASYESSWYRRNKEKWQAQLLLGLVTIKQAFQHCKLTSSDVRLMLPNPYIGSPTNPSLNSTKESPKRKNRRNRKSRLIFFFFGPRGLCLAKLLIFWPFVGPIIRFCL